MNTTQDDLFGTLDQRINKLGSQLLELEANVDWKAFLPLLKRVRIKTSVQIIIKSPMNGISLI